MASTKTTKKSSKEIAGEIQAIYDDFRKKIVEIEEKRDQAIAKLIKRIEEEQIDEIRKSI